ncbi:hypothetical protein ACOANO_29395, partial [Pseudomonas aeruginosa]
LPRTGERAGRALWIERLAQAQPGTMSTLPSPGAFGIWYLEFGPSPGNQKHRKRALNDFRFAPKPSKAVSSHPKAAEAALRLSLRNG